MFRRSLLALLALTVAWAAWAYAKEKVTPIADGAPRYQGVAMGENALVIVDSYTGQAWAWGPSKDHDGKWRPFPPGPWSQRPESNR